MGGETAAHPQGSRQSAINEVGLPRLFRILVETSNKQYSRRKEDERKIRKKKLWMVEIEVEVKMEK